MLQKKTVKIRQKLFYRLRNAMVTFSSDCQLMEKHCSSPDKLYVEHEGEITQVRLEDLGPWKPGRRNSFDLGAA